MKDLGKRMFECMEQYISRKYSEPLAKELIQEFYKVGEVGNFNHISDERQNVLFEAMDYAKKELPYCPYEIIVEENKGGIGLYRLRLVNVPLEQYRDKDPSINQMISEGIIQKQFTGFKMYFPNGIN